MSCLRSTLIAGFVGSSLLVDWVADDGGQLDGITMGKWMMMIVVVGFVMVGGSCLCNGWWWLGM